MSCAVTRKSDGQRGSQATCTPTLSCPRYFPCSLMKVSGGLDLTQILDGFVTNEPTHLFMIIHENSRAARLALSTPDHLATMNVSETKRKCVRWQWLIACSLNVKFVQFDRNSFFDSIRRPILLQKQRQVSFGKGQIQPLARCHDTI